LTTAAEFIAGFEGYAGRAYWDVNHWRLGYGSDTEGPEQNIVVEGMETTKARALQNLMLRIPQFEREAIYGRTGMGADTWEKLTDNQKIAVTSLVYNYGRLPVVITPRDPEKTAEAIRALQTANGGVNRQRRLKEAAFYLTGAATAPQPATPAPVPTVPAQPAPLPVPPVPTAPAGLPPISATSAGRRAAEQAYIAAMLDQLLAERTAIDEEIADFQSMAATLGARNPAPTSALPNPPDIPPAVPPQGKQTVLGITNWQTAFAGAIAAIAGLAKVVPALQPYSDILTSIGLVAAGAVGVAAKDRNVTGGSVPQTQEAASRATSQPIK
jgi:GH24 family phage-related lysozyme (muramidase)